MEDGGQNAKMPSAKDDRSGPLRRREVLRRKDEAGRRQEVVLAVWTLSADG